MFGAEKIGISFGFSLLTWGTAFVCAIVLTLLSYRITNPPLSPGKRAVLIVMRFIAFTAIILMILEPLLTWAETRRIRPVVAIMWDRSKSMALTDKSGDRNAVVEGLYNSDAFTEIRKGHPTIEYAFSDSIHEIERLSPPDGEATAMGDAIEKIGGESPERDPVAAAIIVSDGQANYGENPLGAAYRSKFPIYTVGIGDPSPPKDIVLRQLGSQKIAYVGQEFRIIAGIVSSGYDGRETTANLYREDEKIDEKRLFPVGGGELVNLDFSVTPDTEGVITYRVAVPVLEGELTASNNARSVRVEVLSNRRKILVVSSEPNWETTFFLRALRSDPDLVVKTAFCGKASRVGDVHLPTGLSGLQGYDAVAFIGAMAAVDRANLAPALLEYLRSGGAIYLHLLEGPKLGVADRRFWEAIFPFIYSPGSHVWTEDEFAPELTVAGLVHPVSRVSENAPSPADEYSGLPPLSGFVMATGNSPGAKTLAVHPRLPDVPVISVRSVERGRVVLLNGAGFWRWSFVPLGFGGGNEAYMALVSHSMAWLIASGEGEAFTVETDRRVYRSGERIIVTANLRDEANRPLEAAQLAARVFSSRPDSAICDTLDIVLEERGDGLYTAEIPSIGVGKWIIDAAATLDEQVVGKTRARFLVEPYSLELESVRLDESALRSIAEVTGGEYFRVSSADSLPDLIKTPELLRRNKRERPFWDHPLLLLIFVAALVCEWGLRKRWDLP